MLTIFIRIYIITTKSISQRNILRYLHITFFKMCSKQWQLPVKEKTFNQSRLYIQKVLHALVRKGVIRGAVPPCVSRCARHANPLRPTHAWSSVRSSPPPYVKTSFLHNRHTAIFRRILQFCYCKIYNTLFL